MSNTFQSPADFNDALPFLLKEDDEPELEKIDPVESLEDYEDEDEDEEEEPDFEDDDDPDLDSDDDDDDDDEEAEYGI